MACQPANATGVASSTLLQTPTQASQICTPGPPMSRVTSWSDLPQNEHLSFFRRLRAIMTAAFVKEFLTIGETRAVCQGHPDKPTRCEVLATGPGLEIDELQLN